MNPDPEGARQSILNARQAMLRRDRQATRHWAEIAAAQAPENEEPWLLLAAVASPRASVAYLDKALTINPQSERARKGMQWAIERLRKSQTQQSSVDATQPNLIHPAGIHSDLESTQPVKRSEPKTQPRPVPQVVGGSAPVLEPLLPKALAKYRLSFLLLLFVALLVTAVIAFWPGNASHALALLRLPGSSSNFSAPADPAKPTYTPTVTSTPIPTATPTETETPLPTDTATQIPTDIPLPTDTPEPPPTQADNPPVSDPGTGGVRWIDVNLSEQMLYAYEGDTVVNSFLVSTGVPQFPTVTGQYHIYIKLVSTLMAGDNYYLPDVPYTMYFYKGYGIHGTYWHHNFGHPMSHGCVNMYTPDAEWMFYWASVGTLVNIHY